MKKLLCMAAGPVMMFCGTTGLTGGASAAGPKVVRDMNADRGIIGVGETLNGIMNYATGSGGCVSMSGSSSGDQVLLVGSPPSVAPGQFVETIVGTHNTGTVGDLEFVVDVLTAYQYADSKVNEGSGTVFWNSSSSGSVGFKVGPDGWLLMQLLGESKESVVAAGSDVTVGLGESFQLRVRQTGQTVSVWVDDLLVVTYASPDESFPVGGEVKFRAVNSSVVVDNLVMGDPSELGSVPPTQLSPQSCFKGETTFRDEPTVTTLPVEVPIPSPGVESQTLPVEVPAPSPGVESQTLPVEVPAPSPGVESKPVTPTKSVGVPATRRVETPKPVTPTKSVGVPVTRQVSGRVVLNSPPVESVSNTSDPAPSVTIGGKVVVELLPVDTKTGSTSIPSNVPVSTIPVSLPAYFQPVLIPETKGNPLPSLSSGSSSFAVNPLVALNQEPVKIAEYAAAIQPAVYRPRAGTGSGTSKLLVLVGGFLTMLGFVVAIADRVPTTRKRYL